MEQFFVIKVINTDKAELRKWYRKKEGKMYICRVNGEGTAYATEDFIDDDCSIGNIEPQFCQVLTSFECDDDGRIKVELEYSMISSIIKFLSEEHLRSGDTIPSVDELVKYLDENPDEIIKVETEEG
ncbi:hypothetical protein [Gracilibacillus sp. Marseille-QA3620]